MPKIIIKQLPVELTNFEHIDRAKQQGRLYRKSAEMAAALKSYADGKKAEIQAVNREIAVLADVLETGKEYRPVECFERVNRIAKFVETRRKDTDEIVSTRSLTLTEEQLAFDRLTSDVELLDVLQTNEE